MFANSSRHLLRAISLLSVLVRIATNFTITKSSSFDSSFGELNTTHEIPSVYHMDGLPWNLSSILVTSTINTASKYSVWALRVLSRLITLNNSVKHGSFHVSPKQPNLMGRFQLFTSFLRINLQTILAVFFLTLTTVIPVCQKLHLTVKFVLCLV